MKKSKGRQPGRSYSVPYWAILALLAAITVAAYSNSFKVPLVFDDLTTIQMNPSVRFGNIYLTGSRSILFMLFSLNYLWAGQEVWSYHLVNLLLHILNGMLVFFLAERAFRQAGYEQNTRRAYAALASAFFLVHPVQTESVTYISSRSELLSTVFYLAGMLVFVLWPLEKVGFLCSLAVGVAYYFGIGSKETAVTLPASIFLYDFIFISRADFRAMAARWRLYGTFLAGAVLGIYVIATKLLATSIGPQWPGHLSTRQYFLTELRVLVTYIRLVFFPFNLNLDYDLRPSNSPFEPAVIVSFLFLCGMAILAWLLRRRSAVLAFSIFWFFITLSPTSSFIVIADVIFEHRLYLPMVGICCSFPILIELAYGKLKQRFIMPATPSVYCCIILIALMAGTVARNYTWGDEVRLWEDVVSKSPQKERPYNALAFALYKRAEYGRAIQVLQNASQALPDQGIEFADTLGNLYLKTGDFQKAVEFFNRTIPALSGGRQAIAYNNLGVAYLYMWNDLQLRRGQVTPEDFARKREEILAPAAGAFEKALALHSDMFSTLDSYVNVASYRGRSAEIAALALQKLNSQESFEDLYIVGKLAFNSAVSARDRGDMEQAMRGFQEADQYFERAEKLNSREKLVFFNHGYALNFLNLTDRAVEKYLQAIRIDPIFIEAQHNLGQVYLRKNEFTKAADAFAEVLRFDPKHVSANLNLGYIYKAEGDRARARAYLMNVLAAAPGHAQAAAMLRELDTAVR